MLKTVNHKRGFTLLEILLVVGIIAILAGIVIIAINPTKQLGDTRNAQRRSDVLTILNAAYQYSLDHNGWLPASSTLLSHVGDDCATGTGQTICQDGETCSGLVDLHTELVGASSTYLSGIPRDPSVPESEGGSSGYAIVKTDGGRLTVCAPSSVGEGNIVSTSSMISVTR